MRERVQPDPDVSEIMSLLQAGRHADLAVRSEQALLARPDAGIWWKALSLALSLQGLDALQAAHRAAALMPEDAEAHAHLGNALLRAARFEEAASSYRRALAITPHYPEVYNNLGNALRGLAKPDEALECYRLAIEQNRGFAEGHNNLGNLLRAMGRLDEAASSYRRALEIRPDDAEAWNNLGNVWFDLEQFDDAAASYRRALQIRPEFAEAHSNLGNVARARGRLEDAVSSYRRALDIKPDFAAAHGNLGDALRDLGRLSEAAASCGRAVELAPHLASAHNSMASVLLDLGRLDQAEAGYRHALALEPRFARAWINLGLLLRQRGLAAAAEACCRSALEAKPDAAPALVLLAELRADAGEFEPAYGLLQRAVALDPNSPEALAGMAYLRRMTDSDAAWAVQTERVAASGLPARQEIHLRFALGKYFDDIKSHARAFDNFRRAHELNRALGVNYEPRQQALAVDQLIQCQTAARSRDVSKAPAGSGRAVFIVGMPRSGTTLAEQILASHPAVVGAGELPYWTDAAQQFCRAVREGAPGEFAARSGDGYLELLERLSAGAGRVVDKMPANFWWLGLIHAALPDARVVHMRRDPIDTCLSIYFQHFKNPLPYADDLADLAHFYGQYRRIMAHWSATLPAGVVLEVPYEGLVAEQEAWSRRMLEFVGLAWDPRCLDFHRTRRNVTTASKWQVRQKMNPSAVRRWKNYQPFIAPLLPLLAAR